MKRNSLKKWLSVIGCMVLIAALALTITGCGSKEEPETPAHRQLRKPPLWVRAQRFSSFP